VDCGIVQNYPPDFLNGKISDGYQYTNKKCYTRMDHLKSILIELQCGRSREIESIGQHVQEYLYLNRKLVTFTNVRGCLRKLGYHQHYLHIPSILNYLKPQEFKAWTPSNGSIPRILGLFNQYQEHRSEEHTSELQSHHALVCRLLLENKKKKQTIKWNKLEIGAYL